MASLEEELIVRDFGKDNRGAKTIRPKVDVVDMGLLRQTVCSEEGLLRARLELHFNYLTTAAHHVESVPLALTWC